MIDTIDRKKLIDDFCGRKCGCSIEDCGLDEPCTKVKIVLAQPKVGECSERTNADRIRNMTDEELAYFLCEWADRATHTIWRSEIGTVSHYLSESYKEGDN